MMPEFLLDRTSIVMMWAVLLAGPVRANKRKSWWFAAAFGSREHMSPRLSQEAFDLGGDLIWKPEFVEGF